MGSSSGAALPEQTRVLECRAVGVCDSNEGANAIKLLRALCYHYSLHAEHRVALRLPQGAGAAAGSIAKFVRPLEPHTREAQPACSDWTMRFEGLNMRGKALELPSSVREVSEASGTPAATPEHWLAQGGSVEYEQLFEGQRYLCSYAGVELIADVASVSRLRRSGLAGTSDCFDHSNLENQTVALVPGPDGRPEHRQYYFVEVSARAAGDDYVDAAKAIGAFAPHLLPWVALRKADVRPVS